MRRYIKKQLLEIIDTLAEANQMLRDIFKSGTVKGITNLLADEQDAAISIGDQIEEVEGEGTEAVSSLEKYCEILWQMSQITIVSEAWEIIGQLNSQLQQIKKSIEDIQEQIDVVFLPYKASMWDCMETVWRAADEDLTCKAYVIPIPYYDRNADGSFGQMHYEGDLLPDYVPVTSYQEYLLEQKHPEVIYIHNPYDEYNRVTSVAPEFYSSKINAFTDMLVYIPYFSTQGHLPKTHDFLPAYVYADKIILQNETMAEEISEDVPREKLLIFGSPKDERMIWMESHKDELQLPEEWKEQINGRKVIFYNVSITGFLKDSEKALGKMEEVFRVAGDREDVVLLWRPHPLLEATVKSMRSDLVKRYYKLVDWFVKEKVGILDTTPDAQVSVALSDAYIGENTSSIVTLFEKVNKPRLFLTEKSYYQPTLDELMSERTQDVCLIDDDLWFVSAKLQLLCKWDHCTDKIEVIAPVPEVPKRGWAHYVNICSYENKVILVPYSADALCIYDREKGSFTKHYFKEEYVNQCFGRAILHEHYLFLTPMDYPALVRYDIETGEFSYFEQCITDMLAAMQVVKQGSPFVWGVSSYEEELYIGSVWSNHVMTFHMDTFTYEIQTVGDKGNTYRGMAADEMYCWMILTDSSKVVRWNRATGEVVEYADFPADFEPGAIPFKNIIDMGDKLYLIPFHANRTCVLEKETGKIRYLDMKLPYKENQFVSPYYEKVGVYYDFGKKISEQEIAAVSLTDDRFVLLNVQEKICNTIPIRIQNSVQWELQRNGNMPLVQWESSGIPLTKYIAYIGAGFPEAGYRRGECRPVIDAESKTGENIHWTIRELVCVGECE